MFASTCFFFISRISARLLVMGIIVGLAAMSAQAITIDIPPAPAIKVTSVALWNTCHIGDQQIETGCVQELTSGNQATIESLSQVLRGQARKQVLRKGKTIQPEGAPILAPSSSATSAQVALPSIQEKLLTGMSNFLVDRARQEARLYFEDLLTQDLCPSGANAANSTVFKNTCNVLTQLQEGNYSMSGATSMLRAAIRRDLESYPEYRFDSAKSDPEKAKWLYAIVALSMYQESRGSRDVSEIIGGLSVLDDASICAGRAYASCSGDVKELKDKATLYWYLAENYRTLRDYLVAKNAFDNEDKNELAVYVVASAVNDYSKATGAQLKNPQALLSVISALEIVQSYREQIRKLESQADASKREQASLALRLHATWIGLDAWVRVEYAYCGQVVSCRPDEMKLKMIQDASGLADAAQQKDYSRVVMAVLTLEQDASGNTNANIASTTQFLPLLAEIASAQSSADVQSIIEAAADPVGSYRDKFKSSNLTTITAFAGAAYAKEVYYADAAGKVSNYSWQPFLPVGLQHTWNTKGDKGGVFGVYLSVVDLGTFAMNRSNTGLASSNSNTGFAQVFSPGVYLTWNFKRAHPIVIGIGAERTPKLLTTTNGAQISSTRYQVFLALDLTIFTLR